MQKHVHHPSDSFVWSLCVCGLYCVLSSLCVLHNKYILSSVFPHENCLLLFQNFFTIVFLEVGKTLNSKVVTYEVQSTSGDWIVGLFYSLNVVTGLWALNYLSVPMFSAMKRCNIIVVWIIEYFFARRASTLHSLMPLVTLLVGTFIASSNDLQFSALGYLFGSLSCMFQGASFELGKRLVEHQGSLWSVLMLNSLVSTILQFATILVTNETPALYPSSMTPWTLFNLVVNSFIVMVMNYSIFLNCSVNSPLAHAVTGNLKAVLTVAAGILLFSTPISAMGYVGLVISFAGGGWFSFVKLREAKSAKSKRKKDEIV
jgi:hypothetical protein